MVACNGSHFPLSLSLSAVPTSPVHRSVLRQLLEVFLCNLYGLAPERIGSELAPTLQAHMSRPTLLASVVLVLAFATLSIRDEGVRAIQAKRTLRLLHPYVGCNFGHVRVSEASPHILCGELPVRTAQATAHGSFLLFGLLFIIFCCCCCISLSSQLVVQYLYHRLVTELCPPEWNAPVSSSSSSSSSSNSSSPIGPGDEESSCVSSLMTYLSVDPDLSRLRLRQDSYFEQFSPWRGCTVQGMMANGDEHHHFLHRPLLDQIASVPHGMAELRANGLADEIYSGVEFAGSILLTRLSAVSLICCDAHVTARCRAST